MNFGDKLRTLRKNNKMTQQELANRLNLAKSMISHYETNDRFPSYDVLIKIAGIFRVTTDYLLGVERKRTIDVSDLSEDNIDILLTIADALKNK